MTREIKHIDLVGAKVYGEGGSKPIGRIVAVGVDGEFVRVTVAGIDPEAMKRVVSPGTASVSVRMRQKPSGTKRGFFD